MSTSNPTPPPHLARTIELGSIALLGGLALCGLSGFFISLIPSAKADTPPITMTPVCLSMILAGGSGLGLLWLKKKWASTLLRSMGGILLWVVGLGLLGLGGFTLLSPGETPFVENLGFSLGLCLAPGAVLTLAGLALYGYDYRSGSRLVPTAQIDQRANKRQRAADYRRAIEQLVKQQRDTPLANQMTPLLPKLAQWEAHVGQLVNRLAAFEANSVLQHDLRETPTAIARLQAQLERETNPDLRQEMAETLSSYQQQQTHLDSLATLMRRTELEIEETLATLGTIYSQLQFLGAKEVDQEAARRLSADFEEQSRRLDDLWAAMQEVYGSDSA
ncbi:MAG: hypothetical protein U0401_22865 [Anaerolineae bacterium]